MRRFLDQYYATSAYAAAAMIVGICAVVCIQVVFNAVDKVVVVLGFNAWGLVLPSYAEFTGYLLVGASFMALASTLQNKVHIRVSLFTQKLPPHWARIAEIWAMAVGFAMAAYATYWSVALVYESWRFNDLSPGMIAVPLWVPQTPIALGFFSLFVCLADNLVASVRSPGVCRGNVALATSDID